MPLEILESVLSRELDVSRMQYRSIATEVFAFCRVAVDLCSMMVPGEGLLVGSFARGLFLVHSECSESLYINSRPFRVNCGPVSF